ncbi:MAG: hypothetical protein CTY16_07635, partial [Methylobacter sp.]
TAETAEVGHIDKVPEDVNEISDVPPSQQAAYIRIEASPPATSEEEAIGPAVFSPEHGLLKAVLDCKSVPVLIRVNDVGVYLDPVKGSYYCPLTLEQLIPCFDRDPIRIKPITQPELRQVVSNTKLSPKPLSNLIWYAAFKASQGRLLLGTSPEDVVHLIRWPDLGLPGCGNYVKLAAFMHSNTMKLSDIPSATQYPVEAVYDFYNACHLVGLIEKAAAIELHEKQIDLEHQNLLRKIRNRLKF